MISEVFSNLHDSVIPSQPGKLRRASASTVGDKERGFASPA